MPMPYESQRGRAKVVMFILACLLTACSGDDGVEDLQDYIVEVSRRPHSSVDLMAQWQAGAAIVYSAASLRSPFDGAAKREATVVQEAVTEVMPEFNRAPEALEEFALSSLRMVGIITRGDITLGLIRDESGMLHRVSPGHYIGRNHGRIMSVAPTEITLIEIVPAGNDIWVERPRTLSVLR